MNGTTVASAAGVGNISTTWSVVGTGDFNADGKSDILWRDSSGDVAVWLMNGATVVTPGALGNVPTTWSIAQTGDYNGDGMSDLLWRFMNGTAVASAAGVGNIPTVWTDPSTLSEAEKFVRRPQRGHVWTTPAVQKESDYQRSVRVRSCIRPLSAAV
jgi:FG-GAP-like repeat